MKMGGGGGGRSLFYTTIFNFLLFALFESNCQTKQFVTSLTLCFSQGEKLQPKTSDQYHDITDL